MNFRIILACVLSLGVVSAQADPGRVLRNAQLTNSADTPEARQAAAEQYLKVQPMGEMMAEMAEQMSKSMPGGGPDFKKMMLESIDIKALESAAMTSMVKNFTLGEINALVAFYSSPEGKSVMKKMPQYMRDMMPLIQGQMMQNMGKQMGRANQAAGGQTH